MLSLIFTPMSQRRDKIHNKSFADHSKAPFLRIFVIVGRHFKQEWFGWTTSMGPLMYPLFTPTSVCGVFQLLYNRRLQFSEGLICLMRGLRGLLVVRTFNTHLFASTFSFQTHLFSFPFSLAVALQSPSPSFYYLPIYRQCSAV